ncbi:MAG: FixH family protein [Erythrobacter sp.]
MMHQPGTFSGRHVALLFVGGFGIVVAVNLVMASLAVGSFHGTVVDNSYVASQNYNDWLARAAASRRLGWQVRASQRDDGRVVLETARVPAAAQVAAQAERPLGAREATHLAFAPAGEGRWVSDKPLAEGRWQLRIAIDARQGRWAGESTLP